MAYAGFELLRPHGQLPPPYQPFVPPYPTPSDFPWPVRIWPPAAPPPRLDLMQTRAATHTDTCSLTDSVTPCAVYTPSAATNAPEALAAIMDWRVWRNCGVSACGGYNVAHQMGPVALSYGFDHMPEEAVHYYEDQKRRVGLHGDAARGVIRATLHDMSLYANLQFVEVELSAPANLNFIRLHKDIDGTAGQARQPSHNISWSVLTPSYELSYEVQAHEALHIVGTLRDPYEAGPSKVTLPVGPWEDRRFHTVMRSNVFLRGKKWERQMRLRLGPLDLAVLAFNYGVPPRLVGATTHTVDASFGRAGIHDDDGVNTLKAVSENTVHLDLRTAGQRTCVDDSVARLSPTSYFQVGDISQTPGGVVVGNAYQNILVGSAGDDDFWTGQDYTFIQTGGGRDTIVVHRDTPTLVVAGFAPQRTRLQFNFPIGVINHTVGPAYLHARINDQLDLYLMGTDQLPPLTDRHAGVPPTCWDRAEAEEGSRWRTPVALLLSSSIAVHVGALFHTLGRLQR